jgi:hypothetical protein
MHRVFGEILRASQESSRAALATVVATEGYRYRVLTSTYGGVAQR